MNSFSLKSLLHSTAIVGFTAVISFSTINQSLAQGSLSGSEASQAKNLLNENANEAYLESDYYKQLISNEDIYGLLPDDMRRIFARIRFIALSINDTAASDQVLNALSRAYLIYGMEAAAVNEGVKIILPRWKARTLIDISDYYNSIGDYNRRDSLLSQALALLENVQENETTVRQYYFDISSRFALAGEIDKTIAVINKAFENPINHIVGFLQIAERIEVNNPSNTLIASKESTLIENIKRCKIDQLFALPKTTENATFSLNKENSAKDLNKNARLFVQEAFYALNSMLNMSTIDVDLQLKDLTVMLNLNAQLHRYGMFDDAQKVLDIIEKKFLRTNNNTSESLLKNQSNKNNSVISVQDQTDLRNRLITAYIQNDQIREAMNLTEGLRDPAELSMAYVNAGAAHNMVDNNNTATALFNYAQDVALLIPDIDQRDKVLLEVIRGQSLARLYGSAFQNAGKIASIEYRSEAFIGMAQQMIVNDDLASAVKITEYIQPHDLRIKALANLAYVRSLHPDKYYQGKHAMPATQNLFEEIYLLMENRTVGGVSFSTENEADAILLTMCADSQRQDLTNRTHRDSPIDQLKKAEYQQHILDAATNYTASIEDIIARATGFSNIAQLMLENNKFKEAQLYLDTAWNLAWSTRVRLPEPTDKIFLDIVRGKITSRKITDAYNIATGMGSMTEDVNTELIRNEATGEITFSPRIQALMDFSRAAMSSGEHSIALRAIEDIQLGMAKSIAMTDAIRDLIEEEDQYSIDGTLRSQS